ncbi:MAG: rRNA maturation RNase YbeY [Acidobacteriota bacterium]
MITIHNLQRKIAIEKSVFEEFATRIKPVTDVGADATFSIAFVPDARIKQLNEFFRGKNTTTDVLSFPREPDEFDPDKDNLGDIVISAEQAQKQAAENGLTLEGEIKQLILHGLLHLCGYDHETDDGEMNARELELRELLKI